MGNILKANLTSLQDTHVPVPSGSLPFVSINEWFIFMSEGAGPTPGVIYNDWNKVPGIVGVYYEL